MNEYNQYEMRIADIARDANYALWNALLTLNGIFISVFSVVAVFNPASKFVAIFIIAISMLSALLLVFNFRSIRNLYRLMGQVGIEGAGRLTDEQKHRQLADARRQHMQCNMRETTAHVILVLQSILIIVLVCLKSA